MNTISATGQLTGALCPPVAAPGVDPELHEARPVWLVTCGPDAALTVATTADIPAALDQLDPGSRTVTIQAVCAACWGRLGSEGWPCVCKDNHR